MLPGARGFTGTHLGTAGRRRRKKRTVYFDRTNAELALQRKLGFEPFEYVFEGCHAYSGLSANP